MTQAEWNKQHRKRIKYDHIDSVGSNIFMVVTVLFLLLVFWQFVFGK